MSISTNSRFHRVVILQPDEVTEEEISRLLGEGEGENGDMRVVATYYGPEGLVFVFGKPADE